MAACRRTALSSALLLSNIHALNYVGRNRIRRVRNQPNYPANEDGRKTLTAKGSVIRLILQFFKENGFQDSFATLQDETSVRLNTVDSREAFIDDIVQGRWEVVLKNTMELNIAPRKLMDLYEQVRRKKDSVSIPIRQAELTKDNRSSLNYAKWAN